MIKEQGTESEGKMVNAGLCNYISSTVGIKCQVELCFSCLVQMQDEIIFRKAVRHHLPCCVFASLFRMGPRTEGNDKSFCYLISFFNRENKYIFHYIFFPSRPKRSQISLNFQVSWVHARSLLVERNLIFSNYTAKLSSYVTWTQLATFNTDVFPSVKCLTRQYYDFFVAYFWRKMKCRVSNIGTRGELSIGVLYCIQVMSSIMTKSHVCRWLMGYTQRPHSLIHPSVHRPYSQI